MRTVLVVALLFYSYDYEAAGALITPQLAEKARTARGVLSRRPVSPIVSRAVRNDDPLTCEV